MKSVFTLCITLGFFGTACNRQKEKEPEAELRSTAELQLIDANSAKQLLAEAQSLSVEKSVEFFSDKLLGRKFAWGPLGEGSGANLDADPLYRFDLFDCTTFVETVMALAISKNWESFQSNLMHIRYTHGHVAYETRNHFPDTEWLPENTSAGFLAMDLSQYVMKNLVAPLATSRIRKGPWYAAKLKNLELQHVGEDTLSLPSYTDEQYRSRWEALNHLSSLNATYFLEHKLPYVPLTEIFKEKSLSAASEEYLRQQEAQELAKATNAKDQKAVRLKFKQLRVSFDANLIASIPNASLINMVREVRGEGMEPMVISHQSFLIRKSDGDYLRHASSKNGVVDVKLEDYLAQFLVNPEFLGINVQMIRPTKN